MARFSGHPWCWCRSSRPGWHHHLQAMIFFLGAQPLFNNDVEWCWTSPNPLKQKHVVKWNPHVQGLRIRTFTFFFWLDSHVCWLEHVEKPTTNPSPTTRGSDAGSGSGGGNLLVLAGRFLPRIAGFSRENIHLKKHACFPLSGLLSGKLNMCLSKVCLQFLPGLLRGLTLHELCIYIYIILQGFEVAHWF